jgi:gliding motility-associated-like protein
MKSFFHYLNLKLLSLAALLLASTSSYANHLVGLDLFYTYVSGNTYRITLIAFADCGSASTTSAFAALSTNAPRIFIYNGSSLQGSVDLSIEPPTAGVEITPVCPAFLSMTQCTSLSFPTPGIKKFVYSGNYTLPGTSPVWRFIFTGDLGGSSAGRALSITNISSTPLTSTQLVDTLDNTASTNSNATLTNVPTPFFCLSAANNYNPGAVDPNGDELRFSLVPGAAGTISSAVGGPVTYIPPFSGASPLAVTTSSFDPATGQIAFNPSALQRSLVVYNIREFRSGVFVGSCQREMTFLVQSCTNTPPNGNLSAASAGTIVDNTHFNICQNSGAFTIHIDPYEVVTTNNIYITTSGLPSGMSFTTTGNGTPTPHCLISWTSTGVVPGVYTFYVTYTDNNCPLAGTQTIAYTITILPQPTVTFSLISAATCTQKAAISIVPGGSGAPWKIKVSNAASPFDTIQTFTGVISSFTDSLAPGSYTITIFTNSASGCRSSIPVTIVAPTFSTPTVTFTHPTHCGANDGTIKLWGLPVGTLDTVRFLKAGVPQPYQILLVAADGSVTVSGLTAGTYSGFTVSLGRFCLSAPTGSYTLINPSFTMRDISGVDPSYCGACNGWITLYGLYPGQTDTVTYWRDGFSQPPIITTIGPDSTVTLAGLCPGTYYNFIAHTAGVCHSNLLGPVVLVVPPFTVRTTGHTNPSYCGICNGTLTIYGLQPLLTDTITYRYNGVVQPPIVRTIGADSTAVLTGLCAGIYSDIVVRTSGICVSGTLGPDTLAIPPFTMRALSFTNPPYCGICTGTITLYGLYPGQVDTITYAKDGIAQPPLVFTVAADSTIVLTGLCAGLYDNFVAHTGGVCVSNTLGPANLTVPPFAVRAISHVDPDYCGVCNGVVTLYGLYPGQTDTVTYTLGGVPQPPFIQLVGADSTITITGLCAGMYDDFVAHTGGVCVSDTLGPVSLIVPPFTMRAISHVDPDYCGICNGVITLLGLHPGQIDTITYTLGGVPQPTVIQLVGADSTITISGLCAGTYNNFVARTGGVCVSNMLGPVSLVVPPFTMRALSFTNPPYCGICTGTITLYGLHPGQTDTLSYTKDGVPQPVHIQVIGADSTMTLTGLCAGLYDNFVARTGGVCVSNMLGPANLTVPPFTMSSLSFTNPPYCGICTGTITLHGLYPGQIDTISYTRDGVVQAPVVQTVAADSTIILTGLCAGLYDNLVARTGGVCVSNMLGPANLTVPPFTMSSLTFTNPPYCGICTGTITLHGLYPGQTDTLSYTKDGIAQPVYIQVIAADSTMTLTGLCAGLYDNFVARTGGVCVSNTLGPANLTVPPFSMSSLTFTNPPYCGFCTGTITLHGLYPGQIDTISYIKDGVVQTPVVQTVAADSTIVLTGLCAGLYDNFVARTGGVCVSNMLGPANLTVPPFTMSSLTFTNPLFCGICTGTITLHGLYPGQTDTITFTQDGFTHTPVVQTVAADSTIIITGLCAGTYDNFVARTGGVCVSNMLGPAVLTVPPFTMSSLSFTNPPFCGICTGTITLRGLHPGQTDTVTFTQDGSAHSPIIQVVAADSTITITGLCAGLYNNFVARTGGVCVSNMLGPANLTVPPFTMHDLTFTDPTKCGWCDGKIRLHGLHPGQTDTITYRLNGIAQPPLSVTIGADSTVYFNDLCAGVYSDFVARTAGVCITNTLGPAALVDPPIIPGFNFTVREHCTIDTVMFTNTSSPASDITYRWFFGDGDSSIVTNPSHVYTVSANYSTKLIITNTRCVDSLTTVLPITNILKAGHTQAPDSFICQGESVTFTNTSTGVNLLYAWNFDDGTTGATADAVHVFDRSGVYHITMALSNGGSCKDTSRSVIAVDSISAISVRVTDSVLCDGHVVTFTGIHAGTGRMGTLWSFGDGSTVVNANPVMHAFDRSGTLIVRFDAFYRACPDTFATRQVWVFSHPQAYLGPDTTICPGSNPITLADNNYNGVPGMRWLWSTGEKTSSINITSPGSYWATLIVDGCTATDTINVKEDCFIDVPNAFSPNGDGINDYFLPRPLLARGLATFKMTVYNRWGQTVFETDQTEGRGWDGKINGLEQPEGVYVFVVDATFIDGQKEKHQGNVTLLR